MRGVALGAMAATVVVACGSSPSPSSTPPKATRTSTAAPTATATAAPDLLRIDVLATGVGSWQLVTVPVAVIHNAATRSTASGVLVHLTPTRGGRALTPLLTSALTLSPGQTLVVAANCTDTCVGADGATATVTPGTWTASAAPTLTATTGAFTCTVSCAGHGQWDVPINVGGAALVQDQQVDLFASCSDSRGRIIGGGQRTVVWPQAGGSLALHVPVVVSAPPTSCAVGATTSN